MQKEKAQKRILVGILATIVCVSIDVGYAVPAVAATNKPRWIHGFEEIPEEILTQKVELGTAKEELDLPDYLRAEVGYKDPYDDEEEDEEEADVDEDEEDSIYLATNSNGKAKKVSSKATDSNASKSGKRQLMDVAVVWEDLDDYDMDEPGIYEFQAEFKNEQDNLADDVWPVITVEVEEAKISLLSGNVTEVSSWNELQDALQQDGNIVLKNDIIADRGDSCLTVPEGKNILLDLKGHKIDRNVHSGSKEFENCIFDIFGTLEINNSGSRENGVLTGAWSAEGAIEVENRGSLFLKNGSLSDNTTGRGGVFVYSGGNFTMDGGKIVNNSTDGAGQGAGVYLSENSKFIMNGGEISENTAIAGGAGIYATGAELEINNGKIFGNTVKVKSNGGGIYLCSGSTLTMKGGQISENNSGSPGAGVYLIDSRFVMTGGEISGNGCNRKSELNGGSGVAVDSDAEFEMQGGRICENEATKGAGVYLMKNGSRFIMSGGSIDKNEADERGGGICGATQTAEAILSGGQICDNHVKAEEQDGRYAGISGGGVVSDYYLDVKVSGNIQITGNTSGSERVSDDLYNENRKRVYVAGPLGENASIGISANQISDDIVAAEGMDHQITKEDYQKFFSDSLSPYELVLRDNTILYHRHRWSLSAEENRIKRTCSSSGCGEEQVVAITGKSVVYNGKAAEVELEYEGDEELKATLASVTISYTKKTTWVDAGTYDVEVKIYMGNRYIVTAPFKILPAPLQVKGKDQIITEGENISQSIDQITVDGVMDMDTVTGISLTADTEAVTAAGNIMPSDIQLTGNDGRSVTTNYTATYEPGRLVIWPAEEQSRMTVGSGSIMAEYRVDDNAPQTTIENLTAELAKEILTSEELRQVEAGEHVLVYLDVINIDDTVSAAERSLVETAAYQKNSDMHIGMYLDLSLYKKIGYAGPVKLNSTKGNLLQIQIRMPQSLVPVNGKDRTFYVVRIHNGAAELVQTAYDIAEKTLTFETDRFSTYAIAYADPNQDNSNHGSTPHNSSDSDGSTEDFWWSGKGTGWILKSGTNDWYYIENSGLKKGWHYDTEDRRWYHLDETTGVMDTGWHEIRGIWYYFNNTPTAQTWFMENGEWHYRKETAAHRPYGSMYANEMTPDGWQVDTNGGWIRK